MSRIWNSCPHWAKFYCKGVAATLPLSAAFQYWNNLQKVEYLIKVQATRPVTEKLVRPTKDLIGHSVGQSIIWAGLPVWWYMEMCNTKDITNMPPEHFHLLDTRRKLIDQLHLDTALTRLTHVHQTVDATGADREP